MNDNPQVTDEDVFRVAFLKAEEQITNLQAQLTQAHKERDEARAECAEVRHWVEQLAGSDADQDTTAHQAHLWLTDTTDCGKAFLDRMKEAEWLLSDLDARYLWHEWRARRDAFLKGGAK